MDYGRLNRKELQALCKEHGIPANKTNVFMAEALGALLNAPKESEPTLQVIPDPAEVVKSKASMKRGARSKKVADVLEGSEVDDLSSQLAKSTLVVADSEDVKVEAASEIKIRFVESLPPLWEDIVEPAKVPRQASTQSAQASTKLLLDEGPMYYDSVEAPESEPPLQSIPAEVVKSKASMKRGARSKKAADVLEASEVDDLSSQSAKSSLVVADSEDFMVEAAGMSGILPHTSRFVESISPLVEVVVVTEPAKVPRKARTQSAKANTKSLISLLDAAPALVGPTLEVVLPVETVETTDFFAPVTADLTSESLTYSRRVPMVITEQEQNATIRESISESLELRRQTEEVDAIAVIPCPAAEIVDEQAAGAAKSTKPKAKGKKPRKVKLVSPIRVDILEDAIPAATPLEMPESPSLGLTSDMITTRETQRAASDSPTPAGDEAFEFQPVPESFAEIMTPGKLLVVSAKGCQHRPGRKAGQGCKSCASEKKVGALMQQVLQGIEVMEVDAPPVEEEKTEVLTTPVKQGDDKENALKNVDLHNLSIRKLQKEIKRKGLSRRNNTKVKA